ncbi:putative membrane protein [Paraburkholderia bannensis]|uniref:Putative membrane protein n=1 Tax=Paraburkholderia bannensis TaxID=765414 RepID=A0A7W9U1M6_9BURK|nr:MULTISPECIES: hypothetical protein [Paraburkholderia]MBB3260373.1 putative membrane protein [Paraburkholderia sp. WP4_3_2]MBB6105409.1 putative membrane protein [Paraburkholderia bannensis]
MLAEILGVIEKANSRVLLFIFVGLFFYCFLGDGENIADPLSANGASLIILIVWAYGLTGMWIELVGKMNDSLPENDLASWGPIIGGTILAFCLLITFSYLAKNPQGLTLSILAKKNFLRLCTLYLLGFETVKIDR